MAKSKQEDNFVRVVRKVILDVILQFMVTFVDSSFHVKV